MEPRIDQHESLPATPAVEALAGYLAEAEFDHSPRRPNRDGAMIGVTSTRMPAASTTASKFAVKFAPRTS
jgi:hypothetical protein